MRFNLDAANDLMAKYKMDALLFIDPDSLKYFGYELFFNSARDWMLKPGGTNNYGVTNFCLVPYKKNPIYMVSAFSISSVDTYLADNYDILACGPFIDVNIIKNVSNADKNIAGNKNDIEKKIFELLKKGIFKDQLEALGHALSKYNLESSRIAVEQDCISDVLISNIKSRFSSVEFHNGSELIRLIRMIKTPEEIAVIENCLRITEEAFLKAVNSIKPKTTMKDLKVIFKSAIFKNDAQYEHFFIFPRGMGMTDNDRYIIEKNNILGFDAGVIYNGYTSDTGMTVFFGKYQDRDLEIYKNLYEMVETGIRSVKPGARCSHVYGEMVKKVSGFKFSGNTFEGHGIGMGFREYPAINPNIGYDYNNGFENISSDFIIEKGMVINFETCYNVFDQKTFQIEKTVMVTDSGAESFTFQNRQEPVFI
ncbi:MAG: M24 family metallopeptidase [Actinobacteria bacterium]|nr:M24 family metallopeptidase [Actinomycetota bacterium]